MANLDDAPPGVGRSLTSGRDGLGGGQARRRPGHRAAARGGMALDFEAVWKMADELRDVLPIFTLTEAERRELVAHMHVRRFRPGEVLYHRGDPAADTFVVHREDLPDATAVAEGLADAFGAEPGDRVIEFGPPRTASPASVREWVIAADVSVVRSNG